MKNYRGRQYLDFRIQFEIGNEWRPTKKGIMIRGEDWKLITENIEDINRELRNISS